MYGGIIHENDQLLGKSWTKATKKKAELVCTYPLGFGIVGIQKFVIDKTFLWERTN